MEIGLIDWFDNSKGFGIVKTPNNAEVFFHLSNWEDNTVFSSKDCMPLIFTAGYQRNKNVALNCKYFDSKNERHWEKIFTLKDRS